MSMVQGGGKLWTCQSRQRLSRREGVRIRELRIRRVGTAKGGAGLLGPRERGIPSALTLLSLRSSD